MNCDLVSKGFELILILRMMCFDFSQFVSSRV
jgi:hypothetical protein